MRRRAKLMDVASDNHGRYLLDTHIALWAASAPERLTQAAYDVIVDRKNQIFISAAAIWEIVIKHDLGKLELPSNPVTYIPTIMRQLGFHDLPVTQDHALLLSALPKHHRDPFDRIMIAQARLEGLTFISADPKVARYGVHCLVGVA